MSMMEKIKHKLEDLKAMGYREWLNNNSAAVTVGSVAILLLSLAVMIQYLYRTDRATTPTGAYYYDVVTKELVTDKATRIPPIQTADGHDAVRVHYFTCTECTDAARFVGYYEKYTTEMKDKLEKNPQSFELYDSANKGRLYCPPDADPAEPKSWVGAETPKGQKITADLINKCPARALRYCPATK